MKRDDGATSTCMPGPNDMAYAIQVDVDSLPTAAPVGNPDHWCEWEAPLGDCLGSGLNCAISLCLPCVALAQIHQRVGTSSCSYWTVLFALVGMMVLEEVFRAYVFVAEGHASLPRTWYFYPDDYDIGHQWTAVEKVLLVSGFTAIDVFTFFGTLTGLLMILITWSFRAKIREQFRIAGSCPNDALASCCCTFCVIAQMATQVKTYKRGVCNLGPVDTLPAFPSSS